MGDIEHPSEAARQVPFESCRMDTSHLAATARRWIGAKPIRNSSINITISSHVVLKGAEAKLFI